MYWELRCCGGKSHILTIQHRISKIAENSLVKLGIWLPYNSSLSRPMQPRQTYSPGFTNGRTDKELRQAINPSAAMLRSGLKIVFKSPRGQWVKPALLLLNQMTMVRGLVVVVSFISNRIDRADSRFAPSQWLIGWAQAWNQPWMQQSNRNRNS